VLQTSVWILELFWCDCLHRKWRWGLPVVLVVTRNCQCVPLPLPKRHSRRFTSFSFVHSCLMNVCRLLTLSYLLLAMHESYLYLNSNSSSESSSSFTGVCVWKWNCLYCFQRQYSENNTFYSKFNTDIYGDNMCGSLCRGLSLIGAATVCGLFLTLHLLIRRRNDCVCHFRLLHICIFEIIVTVQYWSPTSSSVRSPK